MTESEELKRNADRARMEQMVEGVSNYLDELAIRINKMKRKYDRSAVVYFIVWICWILSVFLPDQIYRFFTIVFVLSLIYNQMCFSLLREARKELRGAVKVLQLLGYIRPFDDEGEKSTKKRFWEQGIEIVKKWTTKKKELQDKVFQPA